MTSCVPRAVDERAVEPGVVGSAAVGSAAAGALVVDVAVNDHRPRRAAVVGSPVDHSRSPDLHLAAYRSLGLDTWTYDRIECRADAFDAVVAALDEQWIGLSVTMPNKVAALRFADQVSERALTVGSANTLVRGADGWSAECTDIDGVIGALGSVGVTTIDGEAVIVGAGGTARAALAAVSALGASGATVVVRDTVRAREALDAAERLELPARAVLLDDLRARVAEADVVISTVPRGSLDAMARDVAAAPVLLDAIYHPWPTAIAAAVSAAGGRVVGGLEMLLHQAVNQVELFTGRTPPIAVMRAAMETEP